MEDCTGNWSFNEDFFDYVHLRWLGGSIADWNALYKEAYKTLKPGGWVETHEPSPEIVSDNNTITPKTALGQWGKIFVQAGKQLGRTFEVVPLEMQKKALEDAGFVDIQEADLVVSFQGPVRFP